MAQLIDIQNITKQYDNYLLFKAKHLVVNKKDKIGIIGNNGTGKTSLLEIISGQIAPDQGIVRVNTSVDFVPQIQDKNHSTSDGEQQWRRIQTHLINQAALLLVDEPTTNLDSNHINQLIRSLKKYAGTLLVISHDRYFLDAICTKIWQIDHHKITAYIGNFSAFLRTENALHTNQVNLWVVQNKEKKKLKNALVHKKAKAQKATKSPQRIGQNEAKANKNYYLSKQKKLSQTVRAMSQRLENFTIIDKPYLEKKVHIDRHYLIDFKNQPIVNFNHFEGQYHNQLLWHPFSGVIRAHDKIALTGPNGVGKSTFMEEIARNHCQEIVINPKVRVGYFKQNNNNLNLEKTVIDNVNQNSITDQQTEKSLLAAIGLNRRSFSKKVGSLSGGQQIKLSLIKILLSDINFLLLDEPSTYLDIVTIMALENFIHDFEGAVLFITHDHSFIQNVAKTMWHLNHQHIQIAKVD